MRTKIQKTEKVLYPELSYDINGVLFTTRKELGIFCNEKQYCDYIETLFKERGIKYEREKILTQYFEGEQKGRNRVDFLIEDTIILEVKAKSMLATEDYYQVQRYLTSLGKELGILVNMRRYTVTPKRILNSGNMVKSETTKRYPKDTKK